VRTVSATVTALTAAHALAALADLGADPAYEARRACIPEDMAPEFGWRVSLDAVERLFERGSALAGPDFPLRARPHRQEDNRSPVNLYCRTRPTVRAAFQAAQDLCWLMTDGYTITFEERPGEGWLLWHGPPRPAVWWFDAADSAATLAILGGGRRITAVTAPFPAPPGAADLFGCDIAPGPTFGLRFDASFLDHRGAPVDPAVRAFIERQIAQIQQDRPAPEGVVASLWSLGPTATLARLAASLGCSERTVHRRFTDAGTSFRTELDAVRAHFARSAGTRTADERAELLGYSDTRALRRAERRWAVRAEGG
jgi:AraC-like DNA-binding protein